MFHLLDVETRLKLLEFVRLNGRKVRNIGIGLCIFAAVSPWLMVLKIVRTTYWLSFLTYAALVLGMGLFFVGMIYDGYADMKERD